MLMHFALLVKIKQILILTYFSNILELRTRSEFSRESSSHVT